jgi:hypothetical protein
MIPRISSFTFIEASLGKENQNNCSLGAKKYQSAEHLRLLSFEGKIFHSAIKTIIAQAGLIRLIECSSLKKESLKVSGKIEEIPIEMITMREDLVFVKKVVQSLNSVFVDFSTSPVSIRDAICAIRFKSKWKANVISEIIFS